MVSPKLVFPRVVLISTPINELLGMDASAILVPGIVGADENVLDPVIVCVPVVRTTDVCNAVFGIEVAVMDAPDNTGGEMKFLIPSIFSFPVVFTTPDIFVPSIEGGNANDFAPVISCVPVVRTTVVCNALFGTEVAAKLELSCS